MHYFSHSVLTNIRKNIPKKLKTKETKETKKKRGSDVVKMLRKPCNWPGPSPKTFWGRKKYGIDSMGYLKLTYRTMELFCKSGNRDFISGNIRNVSGNKGENSNKFWGMPAPYICQFNTGWCMWKNPASDFTNLSRHIFFCPLLIWLYCRFYSPFTNGK